jgi:hypothetical protein
VYVVGLPELKKKIGSDYYTILPAGFSAAVAQI